MDAQVDTSKAKDRSPPFPFISLAKALERARSFYAEEKRGAAPMSRAVMHWGYSASSSGGLQTAAALRHYGLLDDVGGSGKERQLRLTELALRILLDTRPESTDREAYIRQAATSPTVAQEVYERWPDGLPSDGTLNHYLVLDRKFNETTAVAAIRILRENQQLTGLSQVNVESPSTDHSNDKQVGMRELDLALPVGEVRRQGAALVAAPGPVRGAPAMSTVEIALHHKGVAINIRFSDAPTKEVFEYLAKYCTFEKDNYLPAASEKQRERRALPESLTSDGEQAET